MLDIIILAAGKGSRMRSCKPKVLHSVQGKPLLRHVLDRARQMTPDHIHIVVGFGADQIRESFANTESIELNFIEQREQLGTGHAVQQALPYLNSDSVVLILYGDVPAIRQSTLTQLIQLVNKEAMGLLTVTLSDPTGYGRIIRNSAGDAIAIVEQKDADVNQQAITEVNTGVMAVSGAHLGRWLPELTNDNAQKEYYLTDIIALARRDQVQVRTVEAETETEVLGINNRQQQAQLERYMQQQKAEELLEAGVTLMDPARFDLRGNLTVGSDCIIDVNCIFEGEVKLGNRVTIGANCIIRDSIINDDCVIHPNSIVEQAVLARRCHVGPFARLRPGSELAEDAKIGNFVEIKQASIGEGSKVNHLSYVGDAQLGKSVNVGAGTITCNYDGANKHQSKIGDGVFIGSNSALVAPIIIGDNATIGAGSTVTRDVEHDTLAIARARQKAVVGWQRPKKKPKP